MKKYLLLILMLLILGISNVSALEIPVNSYVIGEYLFTREGSDIYDGVLTTDYLMLASKSISSKDLKDMVIYYKISQTDFINGATGELIEDTFLEQELIENIKYYDMKKIPTPVLKLHNFNSNGKNQYYFDYNVVDNDEDNNLSIGMEFYGTNNFDIKIDEVFVPKYPDSDDFNELGLTRLNSKVVSYDVGSDDKYTILAYPYIEVKSKSGVQKKIYLEIDSSNILSIRNDLTVYGTIQDGKINLIVADSSSEKYKIIGAKLYYVYGENEKNHFDIFDLVNLYKQDSNLKELIGNNTHKSLSYVKEGLGSDLAEEIVDIYTMITNLPEDMTDEIVMYDSGNSENKNGSYYAIVEVCDADGNTYVVPSWMGSAGTWSGIISQPIIDVDEYESRNYFDLFQIIFLIDSLTSLSE